jgi:hypothetical protein
MATCFARWGQPKRAATSGEEENQGIGSSERGNPLTRPAPADENAGRGPPSVAAATEGWSFYIFHAGQGSGGWGLEIENLRSLAPRSFSTQSQVVLNRESCVFEDAHRQATANIASRAHGDGDRQVTLPVPQGEMAS